MADWMLLANRFACGVSIRLREQVLANKAFDVSSVAWDSLLSYLVVRASNPIFRKPTHVAEDDLILVNTRNKS